MARRASSACRLTRIPQPDVGARVWRVRRAPAQQRHVGEWRAVADHSRQRSDDRPGASGVYPRRQLGNEFSLDRPWLGEYHRLALYGRALTAAEVAEQFQAGPDAPIAQPEPTPLSPTEAATTEVATAVPDAVSSAASPQPESTATAPLPEPETAVFSPGILAVGVSVMAILVLGGFFVLRRRN